MEKEEKKSVKSIIITIITILVILFAISWGYGITVTTNDDGEADKKRSRTCRLHSLFILKKC